MFKVLFMYSVYLSLLPDIKDPLKYKTPSKIKLVQVSEKNKRNAVHKEYIKLKNKNKKRPYDMFQDSKHSLVTKS